MYICTNLGPDATGRRVALYANVSSPGREMALQAPTDEDWRGAKPS